MVALAAPAEDVRTPTGLDPAELRALDDGDVRALARWHAGKAGDDDGRSWWPQAVRELPLDARLELASDPGRDAAWERRERLRVTDSGLYFVEHYGHVQPPTGPPEPFLLWPEQQQVWRELDRCLRVWILKARQLGLTWLALHYGFWLQAFCERTPNARILALSKTGDDASKLLERARRINRLLPPFLRGVEDVKTRQSKTEFKLQGRGTVKSLMSTPAAARSETATMTIADEAAFVRNGEAGETFGALGPTLGSDGLGVFVSTGNGDEQTPGDGQAFAQRYRKARAGEQDEGKRTVGIFLPTSVHPDRDEVFYETAREDYDSEEEFKREYPETEDEALAGHTGTKVYSLAGINAAERLGRQLDELLDAGRLPPPMDDTGKGEAIHPGIDWGMGMTFLLSVWPLEQGGIYVPPFAVAAVRAEPGEATAAYLKGVKRLQAQARRSMNGKAAWQVPKDRAWPPLGEARYDAAGAQSMRTFVKTAEDPRFKQMWRWDALRGRATIAIVGIPFGAETPTVKGKGYKVETIGYLQRLFNRAAKGKTTQVIAISPRGEGNQTLLRQLRGLEFADDDRGKVEKQDDHGPDALIAGAAPIAVKWRNAAK